MSLAARLKSVARAITGIGVPSAAQAKRLVRSGKIEKIRFRDDGKTPNNPFWPVLIYRSVVGPSAFDTAALLERLFAANGWIAAWRGGIFTFNHFHSNTHEVLGIARGFVRVRLGGKFGVIVRLDAGDVIVHPAGTGHQRVGGSRDLLVVGAYPKEGGKYDEPRASKRAHDLSVQLIAATGLPRRDPVHGANGPLLEAWRPT